MRALDKKVLAGLAVTILALATVAPFAEAGTYRHRTSNSDYYRGSVTIHRSYPSGGYSYRRSSNAGPVLAGFFGGLLLGAVLTNHSSGQVVYRDPYCDRDFYSRQAFVDHCNTYHRSREVRIVRYSSGRDYYDACRDRGYYNDGYQSSRTYDRDNGRYRGSRGDGDGNNRDYQGDRDCRDCGDNRGDYSRDRDYHKSRDYRQDDGDDDDDD
jgi:hypothetical protein